MANQFDTCRMRRIGSRKTGTDGVDGMNRGFNSIDKRLNGSCSAN